MSDLADGRDICGETYLGMRVAAWRNASRYGLQYPHEYCEHWSTPGEGAINIERLFTEGQVADRLAALSAQNAELQARAERAEEERDTVLRACAIYACQAGLAQGKLEGSEAAGVVEGWRERAERAECERDEMRAKTGGLDAELQQRNERYDNACGDLLEARQEAASLRQALAAATGALERIEALKPEPVGDGVFVTGPLALLQAAQRIACAALAAGPAQPLGGGEQ